MRVPSIRLVGPVAAGTLALWGGVYFGLFSCGGYVWHWQLFQVLLALALVLAIVVPPSSLRPLLRRATFAVSIIGAFILARGVASAFYPAAPSSLKDFGRAIVSGIVDGPC
jgi:hypothetical protein